MIDSTSAMQTVTVFEQTELTLKQLQDSNIIKKVENLRIKTTNKFLSYRLGLLLEKWVAFLRKENAKVKNQIRSNSVFEAIMQDDTEFFETDNIFELMRRLMRSFGTNGKVCIMYTHKLLSIKQ